MINVIRCSIIVLVKFFFYGSLLQPKFDGDIAPYTSTIPKNIFFFCLSKIV